MIKHMDLSQKVLRLKIRNGALTVGGNSTLKIYGRLNCGSGKRMSKENRVFFNSSDEAQRKGYRPCGNCMKSAYLLWKNGAISD
ncbi:MAG: Ada metal-binding domain-containing protein [Cyclobacteriaceae bacterium]